MAKGAAKPDAMGGLHSMLTRVMTKTLENYLTTLEAEAQPNASDLEEDFMDAVAELTPVNPAMLSAISKFLKDNDITLDNEEVNKLSSLEQRLKDAKSKRDNVVSLKNVSEV